MEYFLILLILTGFIMLVPNSFASCISLPCDDANIKLGEPNYRFIDFSFQNKVGEPIKFILEKTAYGDCNSYNAEITDEDGNLVWGEGADVLCDPNENPPLVTSQIKIGYNAEHPIIIDESGRYYIKIVIDDGNIERQFVVHHTNSAISLDRTVYSTPWETDFEKSFSITQKQVKYIIPYNITSGTIDDMKLNCDPPSLVVSISSSNSGVLQLDMPHRMLSGIFMVLVDEVEWDDEGETSIEGHLLTVNFPDNTNTIEIMGSYYISSNRDGACDVFHNPPYSYILPPLKQTQFGILPDDVQCRDDKELVFKSSDDSPACVKSESVTKLIERKWAKPIPSMFRDEPNVIDTPSAPIEDYLVDPADHINASNHFALDFYSKISQNNENIFYSPTSISTAFSILYEGAREDTAKEIQQVFGFPKNDLERKHGYHSLHSDLNEKSSEDLKLQIANALWLAENFEPLPEYVNTATSYYDSTVSVVDFVSDDGVNKINDWVKEKTEDKITELLMPGSTGSSTRMAITNAIYFKGLWEHPFDPEDTYEADFFVNSEKTVKVPMMTFPHKMQINAAFTEQMSMLEMPYKNNTMSILILLPNEIDGLKAIEDSLTLENLEEWKEMLSGKSRGIVVHIPKFSLETGYNLIQSLTDMGMPSVFDAGRADLSGITGHRGLFVSQAIHKAFVDVNEEGTEAAAATAIVLDESGGQLFKADHPFVFIIQDNETGHILFIGRVMDPTG